jgi:ABC-type uncharacterized transport system permease subunit
VDLRLPIEALVGQLTTRQLLSGLLTQVVWIGIGTLVVQMLWRRGVRRYSAVGN